MHSFPTSIFPSVRGSIGAALTHVLSHLPTALLTLFRVRLGMLICVGGLVKCLPLPAPEWFITMVADLGFTQPAPWLWAVLAIWGEIIGGLLLALGLYTRWAAAQLAVQFAVIAFLWYDKPEFFTGLYLQQEMFWALLLLMGLGAGRWSVDAGRSARNVNKSRPTGSAGRIALAAPAVALLLSCLPNAAQAQPASLPDHLQAHLSLRPLEIMNLAAGRPTGFLLRAHNVGGKCVELFERTAAGDTLSRGLLGPDATVTLTIEPGSGVFVQNPPQRQYVRQPLWRRAAFEFEVINGTDDLLKTQFAHQPCVRR